MGLGNGHLDGFREFCLAEGTPVPPRQKDYFQHVHRKVSAPRPEAWDVMPTPLSKPLHIKVGKGEVKLPAGTIVAAVATSSDASPDPKKGHSGLDRDKWVTIRVVGSEPDKRRGYENPVNRTGVATLYHGRKFTMPRQAFHAAIQPPMSAGGAPPPQQ